jgi:hypothetical protein
MEPVLRLGWRKDCLEGLQSDPYIQYPMLLAFRPDTGPRPELPSKIAKGCCPGAMARMDWQVQLFDVRYFVEL